MRKGIVVRKWLRESFGIGKCSFRTPFTAYNVLEIFETFLHALNVWLAPRKGGEEGTGAKSAYFGLYYLPLLADRIGNHPPHRFAHITVCFGESFHLVAIPRVSNVAFLHETFMALAASVCRFPGKVS